MVKNNLNLESDSMSVLGERLIPRRRISRGRTRRIFYKRVNTDLLTRNWILKKYEQKNTKHLPNIIETPSLFILQFRETAHFYLSKEDGKLYLPSNYEYSMEEAETQASIFLEIIKERVVGFYRKDYEPNVEFLRK